MKKGLIRRTQIIGSSLVIAAICNLAMAQQLMMENFENGPETRWNYISDQVMGGVSEGKLVFANEEGESFAHMTGRVSTENNGGFIQFRTPVKKGEKGTTDSVGGVVLKVRGNQQQYYIHLRTTGTLLPWQYYQAGFQTTDKWQTVKIPLETFVPSGKWLRAQIKPGSIRSIGVVAFGRDHSADIQVSEIGFYQE